MRGAVAAAFATIAAARGAAAAPMTVSGLVTDTRSRWTAEGDRIITEATIATAGGDVVVSQLGGSADGLAMRTFPGPELLAPGMRVDVAAHADVDRAARRHVVVDDVKVVAYPAGFVRSGPTKAGHFLYWESGCIFVTTDAAGTSEVALADTLRVIDASIKTWNDGVASCSYSKIMSDGTAAVEVGKDFRNVIKFRDSSWCRPATGSDPQRCYPDAAAGITTAVFVDDASSSRDGAIVDADIELNGVNFAIAIAGVTSGRAGCQAELQNTLTHELGHLHGLAHTCQTPVDPPNVDDRGNPVPLCSATTDPRIVDATMYPFQDCGETKKETLAADDIAAVCRIAPVAMDPGTCSRPSAGGGCCGAGAGASGPAALAALVAATLRRRKTRPRR